MARYLEECHCSRRRERWLAEHRHQRAILREVREQDHGEPDDWAMVPNLWGLAVGPPGIMKSPALAEALRPLHRLVTDAHAQYEEQMLAQ